MNSSALYEFLKLSFEIVPHMHRVMLPMQINADIQLQPYCQTYVHQCGFWIFRGFCCDHSISILIWSNQKLIDKQSLQNEMLEMKWWKIKQQIFTETSEKLRYTYIIYAVTWKSHSRIYNCVPVAALYYLNDMQSLRFDLNEKRSIELHHWLFNSISSWYVQHLCVVSVMLSCWTYMAKVI